jgi:protein-S-isoprenylcysteine O-methyltransferase Ste14
MKSCSLTCAPAPRLPASTDLRRILLWSDVAAFVALLSIAACLGPRTGLWFAGLGLAIAGFVVWMMARKQLGRSFTASAEARQLVSSGLYRYFRHPIYYSGLVAHLGVFLALQNWWILGVWLIYATAIQFARMMREDKVLEDAFGEEFRQLRRGTWF